MAAEPVRALVVDDETLAIERMRALCAGLPGLDLIGAAHDGAAAPRLLRTLEPDLLLLDIAIPGLGAVVHALDDMPRRPAVILLTALDQFAVTAFDVAAVDYLLKPVAADRLARAVDRVAARLAAPPETRDRGPGEAFWVPWRSEVVRLAAAGIDRFEAERDYLRLHVGPRSFLLRETIAALERRLDPARFVRVDQAAMVRRDLIAGLARDGLDAWSVTLEDGTSLRVEPPYLRTVMRLAGA